MRVKIYDTAPGQTLPRLYEVEQSTYMPKGKFAIINNGTVVSINPDSYYQLMICGLQDKPRPTEASISMCVMEAQRRVNHKIDCMFGPFTALGQHGAILHKMKELELEIKINDAYLKHKLERICNNHPLIFSTSTDTCGIPSKKPKSSRTLMGTLRRLFRM